MRKDLDEIFAKAAQAAMEKACPEINPVCGGGVLGRCTGRLQ